MNIRDLDAQANRDDDFARHEQEPRAAESEPTAIRLIDDLLDELSMWIEEPDTLAEYKSRRAKLSTIEAAPADSLVHPAVTPLVASSAGSPSDAAPAALQDAEKL